MKHFSLILLLFLLGLNPALGADFQKALDAYERGDYATALHGEMLKQGESEIRLFPVPQAEHFPRKSSQHDLLHLR